MRVYVDTNAFISALEGTDQVSDLVRAVLEKSGQTVEFLSSELTLGELLVNPLRNSDHDGSRVIFGLFASNGALTTAPIDRNLIIEAADLRASYRALKWPDAIHLATAIHRECSHFLSNDRKLPALTGLETVPLTVARLQTLITELDLAN